MLDLSVLGPLRSPAPARRRGELDDLAGSLSSAWRWAPKTHAGARMLADRHYSRQTPGSRTFLPPGQALILWQPEAVWGVCLNRDARGEWRWRVTIFRNESKALSSDLVREATVLTYLWWGGGRCSPLTTEVDPRRTRRKRDPGRCFVRSGLWRRRPDLTYRGLVQLEATL